LAGGRIKVFPFSHREKVATKGADEGAAEAGEIIGNRQQLNVFTLAEISRVTCFRRTLSPTPHSGPAKHAGRSIAARASGSQTPLSHPKGEGG